MKRKLELLEPDIREGYFKNEPVREEAKEGDCADTEGEKDRIRRRDSESYRVLHIPGSITPDTLRNDIREGAAQFKPALEYIESSSKSDFVIIQCDTEEEGLMAITYLESACDHEETEEECPGEYDKIYEYDDYLPIISMAEIREYEGESSPFPNNQFIMEGNMQHKKHDPYWTDYYGSIVITDLCFVDDNGNIALPKHDHFYAHVPDNDNNKWLKFFKRFLCDGYTVYYMIVRDRGVNDLFEDKNKEEIKVESPFEDWENMEVYRTRYDEDFVLSALILEYTAEMIELKATVKEKEKYYTTLFKDKLSEYGYTLENRFPLRKLLKSILMMEKGPSRGTEKILKYIKHKYPDTKILTKELFGKTGVLKNVLEKEEKKKRENDVTVNDLVGMEDVKKQFDNIISTIKFAREREKKGLPLLDYRNVFMLIGAPGTAKTTMANILGKRMKDENLLRGTRFGSFSGAQLKGEYVGQTAPKIHQIFQMHDIIIIDEAYSLTASDNGGMDTYSQEALAQLAIELEDHGKDRLVFFAGYGGSDITQKNNKMKDFLDANPGIKSRINGTIVFPSYDATQMISIVKGIASRYEYVFEDDAAQEIKAYFEKRILDPDFGNGREARSFVDNCQMVLAERIMKLPTNKRTKRSMQVITVADVKKTIKKLEYSDRNQSGRTARFGFV